MLAYWLIVVWSCVLGAAIGSFLNVVVYRLPLGLSLVTPPSHCPICKTPIRWYDNVPVFGWIVLRGRCRHCQTPIPFRYPLVEAITAAIFGLLALIENPLSADYVYHVVLLCTLLCAVLIRIDGRWPPLKLFLPAVAAALARLVLQVAWYIIYYY